MADTHQTRPRHAPAAVDWATRQGVQLCRHERWEAGLALLNRAVEGAGRDVRLPSVVYSYLGYGIAHQSGEATEGLLLCRHALQLDPHAPENHANLARVLLLSGQRGSAVRALDRALSLAPADPRLLQLRRDLGVRRRPAIGLLPRTHALNRALGRVRHLLTPSQDQH